MGDRLIAIGDIHGCAAEFSELLARLAPGRGDRLILLGDLVNRGPASTKVIDLARGAGALALLGNHEFRLLNYRRSGDKSLLKEDDHSTLEQLRPQDWDFFESMPLTHYVPEFDTVFVHGGFLPGQPWRQQPASVVTRIQMIDRDGRPRRRADCPDAPEWAELWKGPPFVVYGHTPHDEIRRGPWTVDIDTGCVNGGHLTAYVLPEGRFVQVKARRKYYQG